MATTSHTKAGDAHDSAAKGHRRAADMRGKSDAKAAHDPSTKADAQSDTAPKSSIEAHRKSTGKSTGKNDKKA